MSLKPYSKYVGSGVAWLGDIPASWRVARVQDVATLINGFPFDSSKFGDTGHPLIRIRDLDSTRTDKQFEGEIVVQALVDSDDVLVGMDGDFNVGRWLGGGKALLNQRVLAIRASRMIERWLYYALPQPLKMINDLTYATTVKHLSSQQVAQIRIAMPSSVSEVSATLHYLDREAAEIDAFIADQEELIVLLNERRTATIMQAVTKSLDPMVTMKASGVEWIGVVPAHWDVRQIKWISRVKRGASPRPIDNPAYFDEEGAWSWVRIADVSASDGRLRETTQKLSELGSALSVKLDPGQLFVSIAGTVGKPCITEINACIHDGFVYFPDLPPVLRSFLYRIFEAGQCYLGLGKLGTQLNLNTDTIGSISIPVPPASEVSDLLTGLEHALNDLDETISDARQSIALSKERRAALISAAVTGKIDVRDAMVLKGYELEGELVVH